MKHTALIFLITIGFISFVNAQSAGLDVNKREKLEALKVGYLSEMLALTPEEAQTFWPLYNELEDKMRNIRKERRKNRKTARENFDQMSDKELTAAMEAELNFEQQELDLKREYNQKFSKVLPIRKIVQLHQAQDGFKRRLLKEAKEKRDQGQPAR